MSEITNWVPIIGVLISAFSLLVAILTYLKVSRKYMSKKLHTVKEIKPTEERVLFNINGTGSLQKIEMTAKGSSRAMITLTVDGEVTMREFHRSA
jgi:hypothetical protein